jgi:hypothetical protein
VSDTKRVPDWSAVQAQIDAMREAEWLAAHESDFIGDDKYEDRGDLIDEGRSDGYGESYAERNV